MGNAIVLDASVAIKLVLVEEFSDRAEALFETTVRGGYRVVGPPLLNTEVTNGIYQYLRRRLITSSEASQVLTLFLSLGIEIVDST